MSTCPAGVVVGDITFEQLLATAERRLRVATNAAAPGDDPPGLLVTYDGTTLITHVLPPMATERHKALVAGVLIPTVVSKDRAQACAVAVPVWTSPTAQGGTRRPVGDGPQREEGISLMAAAQGREVHWLLPIIRTAGQAPYLGPPRRMGDTLGSGALASGIRQGLACFETAVIADAVDPTPQRPRVCIYSFPDETTLRAAGRVLAARSSWGDLALVRIDDSDIPTAGSNVAMCIAETPDDLDRFRASLDEFGQREQVPADKAAQMLRSRCLLPVLQTGGMPHDILGELAGLARAPRRAGARVGRNAPCPCGSGRKAKRCCAR